MDHCIIKGIPRFHSCRKSKRQYEHRYAILIVSCHVTIVRLQRHRETTPAPTLDAVEQKDERKETLKPRKQIPAR